MSSVLLEAFASNFTHVFKIKVKCHTMNTHNSVRPFSILIPLLSVTKCFQITNTTEGIFLQLHIPIWVQTTMVLSTASLPSILKD